LKVAFRYPGARERDDVRASVRFDDLPELAHPLTFFFLLAQDDEDAEPRWVNVGFAVGASVRRDALESLGDVNLSPGAIRFLMENFFRYRRLAEDELHARSRVKARAAIRGAAGRGGLTDEFLLLAMQEMRAYGTGRGAVNALADARGKNRVTVWRWRKEAERRGLLTP
jgi:hypothetical protein